MLLEKLMNDCYPSELELKPEEIKQGNVKFLETITKYRGKTIEVRHFNKNYESIMKQGEQKFLTVQDNLSLSSKTTKRGVLMSRLTTIRNNCSTMSGKFRAVAEFLLEMQTRNYSRRMLRQICRSLYDKQDDGFWLVAARFILGK